MKQVQKPKLKLALSAIVGAVVVCQLTTGAIAQSPKGELDALRQRVEQLEGQLLDLQVTIGTLQSLARNASRGSGRSNNVSTQGFQTRPADGRIQVLEMQMRALTAQIERMKGNPAHQAQPRSFRQPGSRSNLAPSPAREGQGFQPFSPQGGNDFAGARAARDNGFGNAVVRREGAPDVRKAQRSYRAQPASIGTNARGFSSFAGPTQEEERAYEAAYNRILQRDFAAARASFKDFLTRFPNSALAGNAQYWVGESHFATGRYKLAARAFLTGYEKYAKSKKGADNLLKLAMSFGKLRQIGPACSSLNELRAKFPNAPRTIRVSANRERRRLKC